MTEECKECGQMCKGKRGLGIHVGRMHRDKIEEESKKRKFVDEKKTVHFEKTKDECHICGISFLSKADLNHHMVQCIEQRNECSKAKDDTQKNNEKQENICEQVSKLCSECDVKIESDNGKGLILKTIQHNKICTMKIVPKQKIISSEPTPSPPHKKIKDIENAEVECEIERILNSMKQMEVDEKIEESKTEEVVLEHTNEIKEEERIPERLQNMLGFKGINIKEHKLCRVSGGGKCGYNCISLHTTGSEEMATEIAINKNEHIVSNWEQIYKQCYEFPYTERVGGTSRIFETEEDFLIFLLTDKDASAMWMTHESMQAVSTMMNMNISILTTGVANSVSNSCPRCNMMTIFKTNEELRIHTEIVHHRTESLEEKEGRIQGARWTHLKPDSRIRTEVPNEKAEELILLHEDETHYNIILHKSHTIFKSKNTFNKHKTEEDNRGRTLFGDFLQQDSSSWAEVTSKNRPVNKLNPNSGPQSSNIIKPSILQSDVRLSSDTPNNDDDWKTVNRKKSSNIVYNIPVQNRFEGLGMAENKSASEKEHVELKCDMCDFKFSTKSMLRTHMKVHKTQMSSINECKCSSSKDYKDSLNEVRLLRRDLEITRNELKTYKEYYDLNQGGNKTSTQEKEITNNEESRPSVITYRCKTCNFITKSLATLEKHKESHDDFKCDICSTRFTTSGSINQHMLNEHKERMSQLNCNACSFQSNDKGEFLNHLSSHGASDKTSSIQLSQWKCRNCGEHFQCKENLMEHRRDNHEMPACRDDLEDNCSRTPEICYYTHKSNPPIRKVKPTKYYCYSCQNEFNSLGSMMEHRKEIHPEVVKPCLKAATGECKKTKCWFMHTETANSDFQTIRTNLEHP